MQTDDLTQVKYIGAARMKVLIDSGITTIKKLYEIPPEKLAQIETVGEHYARLIKAAVAEVYVPCAEEIAAKTKSAREKKIEPIDAGIKKQIKIVNKRLRQADEKLKPLGKKKYLELYIDFKKSSKTLKRHLNHLEANPPRKARKKIIRRAEALDAILKRAGKKAKKKKYQKIIQELQSFSKMLKKARP